MKYIFALFFASIWIPISQAQAVSVDNQARYPAWIQYSLTDGSQQATNSQKVSDADLAAIGRAQIEYLGDPNCMKVDVTKITPAVVPDLTCGQ